MKMNNIPFVWLENLDIRKMSQRLKQILMRQNHKQSLMNYNKEKNLLTKLLFVKSLQLLQLEQEAVFHEFLEDISLLPGIS